MVLKMIKYIVRDLKDGNYLSKVEFSTYSMNENYDCAMVFDNIDDIKTVISNWEHSYHDFEIVSVILTKNR